MSHNTFGRYEIQEELGRGGMAIVYHAYDPRFNRDVALKILPREFLFEQSFRTRFEREAQAIAALEHSAIVPVYDFGEQDGQPYFVMRYMPGGSLADHINQGALSLDYIEFVLERIAPALDFAHEHRIIHRDVKPANILFDKAGHPYLGDFGIVKLTEATSQLTGGGMVGTPAYMAPEISKQGGVTPLIDVYALGVTVFQMLTGQLPYQADTPMGILMAHLGEPIPHIHDFRPDLPSYFQTVINRAMAKDPAHRYQSAEQLVAGLRMAAAGIPPKETEIIPESAPIPDTWQEQPPVQPASSHTPAVEISQISQPVPEYTPPPGKRKKKTNWILLGGGLLGVGLLIVIIIGAVLAGMMSQRAAEEVPPAATDEPTRETNPTEEVPQDPVALPTSTSTEAPGAVPTITSVPSPTATDEPTLSPREKALAAAEAGVSSNDEWTPYSEAISGVQMALVPAGCFQMGSPEEQIELAMVYCDEFSSSGNCGPERFADEQPVHEVCFDEPFWIDVFEVTNQQVGGAGAGCTQWSSDDDQPRICVQWADARTHCQSRGARLPTEAEWEYAARGMSGYIFPWGMEFVSNNAVTKDNSGERTWAVGSKPGGVTWIGAYDMSGNVWEWVNDWYDPDYYGTLSNGVVNPQGASSGTERMMRGGSWGDGPHGVRSANRSKFDPSIEHSNIGFRCARSYSR